MNEKTGIKSALLIMLLCLSSTVRADGVREAPPSGSFCQGNERAEYRIVKGDVVLMHGKKEYRGPTAYSYFMRQQPPKGFVVALLVGKPGEEALLFEDRLEWRGHAWKPCPATAPR
jgi:hypothetical protein